VTQIVRGGGTVFNGLLQVVSVVVGDQVSLLHELYVKRCLRIMSLLNCIIVGEILLIFSIPSHRSL
jgi:hypothetical protein